MFVDETERVSIGRAEGASETAHPRAGDAAEVPGEPGGQTEGPAQEGEGSTGCESEGQQEGDGESGKDRKPANFQLASCDPVRPSEKGMTVIEFDPLRRRQPP